MQPSADNLEESINKIRSLSIAIFKQIIMANNDKELEVFINNQPTGLGKSWGIRDAVNLLQLTCEKQMYEWIELIVKRLIQLVKP